MRHDVVEVVDGNESIVVKVSSSEDGEELLLSDLLTEVFGDSLQFIDGKLFLT